MTLKIIITLTAIGLFIRLSKPFASAGERSLWKACSWIFIIIMVPSGGILLLG